MGFGQLINKYLSVPESIVEREKVEVELIVANIIVPNEIKNGLLVSENLFDVFFYHICVILIIGIILTGVIDAISNKDTKNGFFLLPRNR